MSLRKRWVWLLAMGLSGMLLVSCTTAATPTPAPATPAPIVVAQGTSPVSTADLMNKLFPQGAGRDLVLNNCLDCHGMGVVAIGGSQKDAAGWDAHKAIHRAGMVPWLTDAEASQLWGYLKTTFNSSKPLPVQLPNEFVLFYEMFTGGSE